MHTRTHVGRAMHEVAAAVVVVAAADMRLCVATATSQRACCTFTHAHTHAYTLHTLSTRTHKRTPHCIQRCNTTIITIDCHY